MKRMIVGVTLAGLAFFLAFLSYMAGTSNLQSSLSMGALIVVGLVIYFWGRKARKKGVS